MEKYHLIPKVFIDEYIYKISPDAFCTLVKFYTVYLKYKGESKEIKIPFSVFRKQILNSDNKEITELVWSELDWNDLVKRYYKNNQYELNLTRINSDLGIEKNEKFRIIVVDSSAKIKRKKGLKLIINNYIERILLRYTENDLKSKIKRLLDGTVEYFLSSKGKVEISDLDILVKPLLDIPNEVLVRVCEIYEQHYGKKHPKYILGIVKNVEKVYNEQNKEAKVKKSSLNKYEEEKDESDKIFALKLVTGKVENNLSYKAYLESKDFENLRKLYDRGKQELRNQNREHEIYLEYEWLTENRTSN